MLIAPLPTPPFSVYRGKKKEETLRQSDHNRSHSPFDTSGHKKRVRETSLPAPLPLLLWEFFLSFPLCNETTGPLYQFWSRTEAAMIITTDELSKRRERKENSVVESTNLFRRHGVVSSSVSLLIGGWPLCFASVVVVQLRLVYFVEDFDPRFLGFLEIVVHFLLFFQHHHRLASHNVIHFSWDYAIRVWTRRRSFIVPCGRHLFASFWSGSEHPPTDGPWFWYASPKGGPIRRGHLSMPLPSFRIQVLFFFFHTPVKRETVKNTGDQKDKREIETRTRQRTFFNELVPLFRPGFEILGVVLLNLGSVRHQLDQIRTQSVAVLDPFRRPFVIAGLPKRPARRRQQVLLAVMRHLRRAYSHNNQHQQIENEIDNRKGKTLKTKEIHKRILSLIPRPYLYLTLHFDKERPINPFSRLSQRRSRLLGQLQLFPSRRHRRDTTITIRLAPSWPAFIGLKKCDPAIQWHVTVHWLGIRRDPPPFDSEHNGLGLLDENRERIWPPERSWCKTGRFFFPLIHTRHQSTTRNKYTGYPTPTPSPLKQHTTTQTHTHLGLFLPALLPFHRSLVRPFYNITLVSFFFFSSFHRPVPSL